MKIGFIGCGSMGKAMVEGILNNSETSPEIYVYDHHLKDDSLWVKQTGISALESESAVVEMCDYIIFAIKPYAIPDVLHKVSNVLNESKVIVSIAANLTINQIAMNTLLKQPIIRLMPNVSAKVGESMTAVMPNKYVSDNVLKFTMELCEKFGIAEIIDESKVDAFVAVSGSSPAYYFEVLEGIALGGIEMGLSSDSAYRYAAQAMKGAAKMYLDTKTHPAILRDSVCSPKGTTIEAVHVIEKNNVKGTMMEAVKVCAEKSSK